MTLKRKSLIRAKTHFFWYTLALVFSMIYILKVKGALYCAGVGALFFLKIKFNLNKYLMWSVFTVAYYVYVYDRQHGIVSAAVGSAASQEL